MWHKLCRTFHPWCLCIKTRCLLSHWGRVTHICVGKTTIIGSDNGLSPGWRQAIIWTNGGILSIGPLGTNFNEILIGIQKFSMKKMHFKVLSAKWRPSCLSLNMLSFIHDDDCCFLFTYHTTESHWLQVNITITDFKLLPNSGNYPWPLLANGLQLLWLLASVGTKAAWIINRNRRQKEEISTTNRK